MALKREVYRALEDILGPKYISEDPVVLYSYSSTAVAMGRVIEDEEGEKTNAAPKEEKPPMFEAITLPKDTLQVQAIVKLCNKHKIQFKASSTGQLYCDPAGPGCIKIDLRRMNRIIEINEKGMYAVCEPYVVGGQLQAELMKRGFNCNLCGGGTHCSALTLASHANMGHLSISGSYGERTQLALEWVTGDGEIVQFGSLGSIGEWFCGDGPGPSLRGIVRGNTTPLGGLGVYTKSALKLYHWAGPPVMPVEGVSPNYTLKIPDNFLMRYYSFIDNETLNDTVRLIGESEIAYECMSFAACMVAANKATANKAEEFEILAQIKKEILGPGCMVVLAGNSQGDFEYKKQVLEQIVKEKGGKSLNLVEDPQNTGGFMWRWVRLTAAIKEIGRSLERTGPAMAGGSDLYTLQCKYINRLYGVEKYLVDKGLLDPTDPYLQTTHFIQPIENAHLGHGEIWIAPSELTEKQLLEVTKEFREYIHGTSINEHYGIPHCAWGDGLHNLYGPHASNYHKWMRKIKTTFDPNNASEGSTYITPEKH
jgi:glycolate oxidase